MSITTLLRETPRLSASGLYWKLVWWLGELVGDGPVPGHGSLQERGAAKGVSLACGWRVAASSCRLGVAATLMALACAAPQTAAQAQTTFISNTTTGGAANTGIVYNVNGSNYYSQPFTTGTHASGYNISGVGLRLHNFGAAITSLNTVFALREDSSGDPSNTDLAVLSPPATIAAGQGLYTFTAPSGTVLLPDTTYHVIGYLAGGGTGISWYRATLADGLDAGTATGWSLPGVNRRLLPLSSSTWGSRGTTDAMQIQIIGSLAIASVSVDVPEDGDKVTTGDNVVFVLSRTGDTSEALTVNVTWSGATGLADTSPSTTVDFAAGDATTRLSLASAALVAGATPVNVTLTVADATGGEYQPGTPAAASVLVRPPNRDPDPASPPEITGDLVIGETLRVDVTPITDADVTSTPTYSFQWQRAEDANGTNEADVGIDIPSYRLSSADEGGHIRVVVSYTDEAGYDESIASEWIAMAVAAAPTLPEVTVRAKKSPVVGAAENAVFVISRATAADTELVVQFSMAGERDAYQDYDNRPSTATIPRNETSVEVEVSTERQADGDMLDITLTISTDSAYTIGADSMAAVTVTDAAAMPSLPVITVSVAAGAESVVGGENAVFTLSRTGAVTGSLTVTISVSGTGASGTPPTTATFPLNSATVTVPVPTSTIATGSPTQTVTLTVQPDSGNTYTIGSSPGNTAMVTVEPLPSGGAPEITGTAKVGLVLTSTSGTITDPDGLGSPSYTYQWQRLDDTSRWVDISGAMSATYTLVTEDRFRKVRVVYSFMDALSNPETRTSAPYPAGAATVVPIDNVPATGEPTISGAAAVGSDLTASPTGIMDTNGLVGVTYSYQWQRADEGQTPTWTDISGATLDTYTAAAADEDKILRVVVSFSDEDRYPESRSSAPTVTVLPALVFAVTAISAATVEPALGASATAANQIVFTVTPNRAPDQTATVTYSFSGTAIEGTDYEPHASKSLSFSPGSATTQTITITAIGDIVAEGSRGETVIVTVGGNTAAGTINEPAAQIAVGTTTPTISFEGGSTVVRFSFSALSAPAPAGGLAVDWRVNVGAAAGTALGRSAGARAAFTCTVRSCGGTVTYPAGSTTLADPAIEAVFDPALPSGSDVQVQVRRPLSAANLAVVPSSDVAASSHVIDSEWVVTGVETVPEPVLSVVTVAAAAASVVSGENAMFTLSRTENTAGTLQVTISVSGTGASGTPPTTATFPLNSATVTVPVPTSTLAPNTPSQSVTLTIQPSSNNTYTVGSARTATVTVVAPTLGFTVLATSNTAVEPAPGAAPAPANQLVFTVRVTPAPAQATTQAFTLGGTAENVLDYTVEPANLMLDFGPSTTTRMITVTALDDIVAEGAGGETVVVAVGESSATGTISERPARDQIVVETTPPSYRNERGATIVSFSFAPLSSPAPAGGLAVDWRVNVGAAAGTALGRSAGTRVAVSCSVSSCGGTVTYAAGSTTLSDPTIEAEFDTELAAGSAIQVQVKPATAAADLAVVPAEDLAPSNQVVEVLGDDWVVAGVETVVLAIPAALTHSISSFGSTVAANIITSVWRRADVFLDGTADAQARVGGRTIDAQALTSGEAHQTVREVASLLGIETASPEGSSGEWDDGLGYGGGIDDYRTWAGIPDRSDLAGRTSFALPVGARQGNRVPFAFWGEFRETAYEGEPEDGGSVEMELSGSHFGVDYRSDGGMLFGISASSFSGTTDYAEEGEDSIRLESDVTVFAPYVLWSTRSGLSVWTSMGFGEGTLVQKAGGAPVNADMAMQILATGIRHEFWRTDAGSTAIKGDTLQISTETENASSSALAGLDVQSTRVRLALEFAEARTRRSGDAVSHRFELGVRAEAGEEGTGAGTDIASELRYVFPKAGLELQGHASMLLLHSQAGQKEWGLGLGAIYDPGVAGRGMRLSLDPTWNTPRSGAAESMWNAASLDDHASANASASLQARLGYGTDVLHEMALATLYGETETGSGERRLRLGAEMRGLDGPLERLNLDLYGERKESRSATPDNAIMLESELRF